MQISNVFFPDSYLASLCPDPDPLLLYGKQCCGSGDVYPGSDFFPSRIPIFSVPEPGSTSTNLSIFLTQKIVF
jgi:hypothetical protein